jgi:hypothetical protein
MPSDASNLSKRLAVVFIALLTWLGLLIQFYVSLTQSLAAGKTVLSGVSTYFSFFTILTNLLIALGLTLSLAFPRSRPGSFFSLPGVQTATAIYIAVVGIVYSLVLRHLWDPEGLQKVADLLLHDIIPILYIVFWIAGVQKHALRGRHALLWLIYPAAYLVYALFRGAVTGTYPYPFIDVTTLGYPRMFANAAVLLFIFLGLGLTVVALARWRSRSAL